MNTLKITAILLLLFLVIVVSFYLINRNYKAEKNNLKLYNQEFEMYLNKTITGTELATLINKVIELNEKNNVEKDKKKHYIDNEENSIIIEVKIGATDKTYSMEEFYNNDISEFVKYFSDQEFICSNVYYHNKTGKVSKMVFIQ